MLLSDAMRRRRARNNPNVTILSEMDMLFALGLIMPSPDVGGAPVEQTEFEYNKLRWYDERPKPTWAEVENAWAQYRWANEGVFLLDQSTEDLELGGTMTDLLDEPAGTSIYKL